MEFSLKINDHQNKKLEKTSSKIDSVKNNQSTCKYSKNIDLIINSCQKVTSAKSVSDNNFHSVNKNNFQKIESLSNSFNDKHFKTTNNFQSNIGLINTNKNDIRTNSSNMNTIPKDFSYYNKLKQEKRFSFNYKNNKSALCSKSSIIQRTK